MFKYVWIMILVGFYLFWGYSTVKDIIDMLKLHCVDNILELFDFLDPSSHGFIILTVFGLVCSSFVCWVFCIAGG